MEIILKEDVANLGYADEIVNVKNGYARNYLFPNKLAIQATESNKKVLAENLRQRILQHPQVFVSIRRRQHQQHRYILLQISLKRGHIPLSLKRFVFH